MEGYLESGTFLKMCFIDTVNSTMMGVEYFKGICENAGINSETES